MARIGLVPLPKEVNVPRLSMKFLLPITLIIAAWFAMINLASAQVWQPTGAPNSRWFSPQCSADGRTLVAKVGSYLLSSTNSGVSWFTNGAPSNSWTYVAASANGSNLVACAAAIYNPTVGGARGGPIYTSRDAGASWRLTSAPSNQWTAVASSSDGLRLVAVAAYNYSNTAYGLIYVSTNSGTNWMLTSAPTNRWNCVASSADGTRLIAGCSNLFVSTDSGATWKSNSISADSPPNSYPSWTSVAVSADGSRVVGMRELGIYSGGNMPRVYTSTNYGVTWTAKDLSTAGNGFVAMSADGSVMMASKAHLFVSTNAGVNWLQKSVPGQTYGWGYGCVASSADGNKLYLALGADDFGSPNSIYTAYMTPKPKLSLQSSGSGLVLSWTITATNFIVQQKAELNTGSWLTLTNTPQINLSTLQNQVSLPRSNRSGFFRLKAN